jgi:hypothetical protein
MRVAVLGCGPAGLMAAHAAKTTGARVDIYSRKRKSEMFGCQYLHAPIPGMTDVAPVTVRYHLHGDAESYRRKVYGDGWDGTVSPEDLLESHDAWDIRRTYDNLWAEYGPFVFGTELSAGWVGNFMEVEAKRYDLIINSVPRPVVCRNERHAFPLQKVWAAGDAPERGMFAPIYATNNSVVCNGLNRPTWYRAARVFGYTTVEWPHGAPLMENVGQYAPSEVSKPLETDCDCWPDIVNVGRYGRWEKGVLSHTAYQQVMETLVVEATS